MNDFNRLRQPLLHNNISNNPFGLKGKNHMESTIPLIVQRNMISAFAVDLIEDHTDHSDHGTSYQCDSKCPANS